MTAVVSGREIPITTRETFQILYKLLSYPKKTISRAQLLDEFWGVDTDTGLRAVDVYITKLRDKFSDCDGFEIKTVRGLGGQGDTVMKTLKNRLFTSENGIPIKKTEISRIRVSGRVSEYAPATSGVHQGVIVAMDKLKLSGILQTHLLLLFWALASCRNGSLYPPEK